MTSREQLNGLVILNAYLQRISVYENVMARFAAAGESGGGAEWGGYLGELKVVIEPFGRDSELSEPDRTRMLEILVAVSAGMTARRPDPEAALPERLAAVAGDLYGAKHRNDGIVYWGDMFDGDVADRFRQQIPFHWSRTRAIGSYVAQALAGTALSDEDEATLAAWFTEVCSLTADVDTDLAQTARLLAGAQPA